MADEEKKPKKAEEPKEAEEKKEDSEAIPEPVLPDTLPIEKKKRKGDVTVKIWVLILMFLPFVAAPFYAYKSGYKNGYASLFKQDLASYRPRNEYSQPIYPILDIEANLADAEYPKYIHLSLHLELNTEKGLDECAIKEPQIRDVIISFLSNRKSFDIDSWQDQKKLKRLLRDEVNARLTYTRISEIYYSHYRIHYLSQKPFTVDNPS